MHTTCSDGRSSPQELRKIIHHQRLSHWSITDHDTTAAYHALADNPPPITGVELSTAGNLGPNHDSLEIHLTGLGIDHHDSLLQATLLSVRQARRQRIIDLLPRFLEKHELNQVTIDTIIAEAQRRQSPMLEGDDLVLTRSHVHGALRRLELTEAAERLFSGAAESQPLAGYFPSVDQGIAAIRAAGGVAVLAHPGCYRDHKVVTQLLQQHDFDGIESNHPRLTPHDRSFFKKCAEKYHLLESCGSDFHGTADTMRPPGRCRLDRRRAEPLLRRLNTDIETKSLH